MFNAEPQTVEEDNENLFSNYRFYDYKEDFNSCRSIKDVIAKTIKRVEQRNKDLKNTSGMDDVLKTGFNSLDLHNGELCVLSSKPAMGKSAFAFSLIKKIAVDKKLPVGLITLGNYDDITVGQRLTAMCSGVAAFKVQSGMLRPSEIDSVLKAASKIYESPVYYYNEPNSSYPAVEEIIKDMVNVLHVKFVIIDGFEFFKELVDSEKSDYRDTLNNLLIDFHLLTGELSVPIMLVVDLPEVDSSTNEQPTLQDFKRYMCIPFIADKVIFVHRDRVNCESSCNEAKVIIAKDEFDIPREIDIKFHQPTSLFC